MEWISPHFGSKHFPKPHSPDAKIAIFADAVRGWHLDVARQLAYDQPNAGYAVLTILLSYFEMYAKYEAGYVPEDPPRDPRSPTYFKRGAKAVLGRYLGEDDLKKDAAANQLYEHARCALYHVGRTRGIGIDERRDAPVCQIDRGNIIFNALGLAEHLQSHFSDYVARLLDAKEDGLRDRFERRYDFDHPA